MDPIRQDQHVQAPVQGLSYRRKCPAPRRVFQSGPPATRAGFATTLCKRNKSMGGGLHRCLAIKRLLSQSFDLLAQVSDKGLHGAVDLGVCREENLEGRV
jgi:hypothetical protein